MTLKTIKVSRLKEHPQNKVLFSDIRDENPSFWREFKASIEEFGILEPLVVNRETLVVRSGNQRLLAAIELELEEVPVLLVDEEDTDEEIRRMIASNVYRRQIDPFALFEYIGRLRIGHIGLDGVTKKASPRRLASAVDVKKIVHKREEFVSASDIFNTLPKEQQKALKAWFNERVENERGKERVRTEGELIARLRTMETEALKSDERVRILEDENKSYEERKETLEELLFEKEKEITKLKDLDTEEEIAERDAMIRKLEKQKTNLKEKLLKEKDKAIMPDISKVLDDSIMAVSGVNVSLEGILEHKDQCDPERVSRFYSLVIRTVEIIKNNFEGKEKWLKLEK